MTSILEFPPCPVCQSTDRETIYTGFGEHNIVRCRKCRVHYLYPRLTQEAIIRFYENDNYFGGGGLGYSDTGYTSQEKALRATFRKLMQNMERRGLTGGSLLEIGCGYGYLLEEARDYFERRVGTEFSPRGAEQARQKADEVFEGGVEAVPADSRFNCIIGTQVIEHVYDPLAFIRELIGHAVPDAAIVLSTPDIGGMLKRVMGRRWPSFKIPEHVLYFDEDTLSELMRKAGLSEIGRLPHPHAFPLALIAAKFGLRIPAIVGNLNIWVPATSIALYGRVG
jgi:SAM-dependent methyltransferase